MNLISDKRVMDVFCGAGGLSEGFKQAGFEVVLAIDSSSTAIEAHAANHPDTEHLCMDIRDYEPRGRPANIVIGSPPCVEFSRANQKPDPEKGLELVEEFLRIIEAVKPLYWIMENVPPLETYLCYRHKHKLPVRRILNAANYGVPQSRERLFSGLYIPPKPTHSKAGKYDTLDGRRLEKWRGWGEFIQVDDQDTRLVSCVSESNFRNFRRNSSKYQYQPINTITTSGTPRLYNSKREKIRSLTIEETQLLFGVLRGLHFQREPYGADWQLSPSTSLVCSGYGSAGRTVMQLNLLGETPIDVMEKHLKVYKLRPKKCCFGFSGGDDSTVLIDKAVEMFGPDIPVVFSNTHVQFQETYKFVKEMVDYWGLTTFAVTHPIEQFIDVSTRVGLHGIAHNKMICCSGLKNKPLSIWMKENDKTITISGLRRSEGKRNCSYAVHNWNPYYKVFYHSPMMFMEQRDVGRYFEETGCPKNPLYGMGMDRTGCAPCPNALKLRTYPVEGYNTYYDLLADKFPRWYKMAWYCQKLFYDKHCEDGDQRGYGDMLYRHQWKWSLATGEER